MSAQVFDELADGVFRRRYDSMDLNVGLVVSDTGVLVVDTRCSHAEADELLSEIRALTRLPVRWVVDTHWHWDHTFGNARFGDVEIWGHDLCRRAMVDQADTMMTSALRWLPEHAAELEKVVITPPSRVFTESTRIDLGSKTVTLGYHGRGHTDSDISIVVDEHDVMFLGDLVEESGPPHFDDGFPIEWPRTLGAALSDRASVIVPGHGDTMSRGEALQQVEELEEVAVAARAHVYEGEPIAELAKRGPYPVDFMVTALSRAVEVG